MPEQAESNPQDEKKAKGKRKDPSSSVILPKTQTMSYRLYRSDNLGNINEVSYEEFEELMTMHP